MAELVKCVLQNLVEYFSTQTKEQLAIDFLITKKLDTKSIAKASWIKENCSCERPQADNCQKICSLMILTHRSPCFFFETRKMCYF